VWEKNIPHQARVALNAHLLLEDMIACGHLKRERYRPFTMDEVVMRDMQQLPPMQPLPLRSRECSPISVIANESPDLSQTVQVPAKKRVRDSEIPMQRLTELLKHHDVPEEAVHDILRLATERRTAARENADALLKKTSELKSCRTQLTRSEGIRKAQSADLDVAEHTHRKDLATNIGNEKPSTNLQSG